ncbi:MAG: cytochrome c oxidase subunit, partial [Thermoleophilaceae bacterium]|nr:cytochrome c oxidase subunit [Thermoleophilaceae bacterium]
MRVQLSQPDNDFINPRTYSDLMTMHGSTMIFLFLVPVGAAFGNY